LINYSIIIPHKNSFDELFNALKSIPVRDDIEVLIIDNSSTQIKLEDIECWTKNKMKLLFSDKDLGAGHARNIGLKMSTGKWILFLDADDVFIKGAFNVFDKYKSSNLDLIYFKTTSEQKNSNRASTRHVFYSKLVSDFLSKYPNSLENLRYKFFPPWGKLIKHKLIKDHNILFDEIPASNDLMFSTKIGHCAKKITADESIVYCVTESNNSLTKTITRLNSRSRYKAAVNYYNFMAEKTISSIRPNLIPQIIMSIQFGLSELFWYVSYSWGENVSVFTSFMRWPKVIQQFFRKK
tara:strand:+ start:513 stop:1397 length:885 start_codon:yes stop_codon:yes gene_type:complete